MDGRSNGSSVLVFVVLLLVLFCVMVISTPRSGNAGTRICIDPGHGGTDPGAVNEALNLRESDINLDVSYALKALLESDGAVIEMTRTDDSDKSTQERYTFCNARNAAILVSVHTNSVSDPSLNGALGLYFDEDDRALAQTIYNVMHRSLARTAPGPAFFMNFGLDRFSSGLLMHGDMPAVIVEPVFLSNTAEAQALLEPIYLDATAGTINQGCSGFSCRRGQIAEALHQGVINYFDGNE